LEQAQDTATKILAKLEEIDFKGLINALSETVEGVHKLVNGPEIQSSLRSLAQTLPKVDEAVVGIRTLTTNLDGNVTNLTANLQQTSDAARQAMQQADITLKQADGAVKAAEAAMTNINGVLDPDSPTFYELRKSLREVSAAARSLRLMTNTIERNPRALIFGKPENQEGK
jgi:paraquat-inducible protein B